MKAGVGDPSGERTLHEHHSRPLRLAHELLKPEQRLEGGEARMRRTGRKRQEVRHQSSRLQRLLHTALAHTGLVTGDRNLFVAQTLEIGDCEQLDPDQSVMTGSLRLPGELSASGGLRRGQKHGQGQPTRCPLRHVPQHCCPARPAGPPQGESKSRPVPPAPADTAFLSPLAKAKRYPKE